MASTIARIEELARTEFPDLTTAELILIKAAVAGTNAVCTEVESDTDPAEFEPGDLSRIVRASLLRWLCVDREGSTYVDAKGIHLRQAYIKGKLDLSFVSLDFPLTMVRCSIRDGIDLTQSTLPALALDGSVCGRISGTQLVLKGSLFLREGFRALGGVRLQGAVIQGSLECSGGCFASDSNDVINANGLSVAGSVFMDNRFVAKGSVRLVGASIGKMFICSSAQFLNRRGESLAADGIRIGSSLLLDREFTSLGEIRLVGGTIGGDLSLRGARLLNAKADALSADGIKVGGSANLNRRFRCYGKIRLVGAEIKRDITFRDAQLRNAKSDAVVAERSSIGGNLYFDGQFSASGILLFSAARVNGDIQFRNSSFFSNSKNGFVAENAIIHGRLFWKAIKLTHHTVLNLNYASAGQLADDMASWPIAGNLHINGFAYRTIIEGPNDARHRLEWLRRQPQRPFYTQPYDQVADVFRKAGQEDDAVDISIAREDARLKFEDLSLFGRLQQAFLKYFVDYGYKPHYRAMIWATIFVFVGAVLFEGGYATEQFSPTRERVYLTAEYRNSHRVPNDYPVFNSFMFSFDTFVPFIDMHQEDFWVPNANRRCTIIQHDLPCGAILRGYLWFHISMGWALMTLFAIGFAGAVRKV